MVIFFEREAVEDGFVGNVTNDDDGADDIIKAIDDWGGGIADRDIMTAFMDQD